MRRLVETFKALSDESRLKIINILRTSEMPVSEISLQLGLSQAAVSYHLQALKYVGIVLDSRKGKWIYYGLNLDVLIYLATFLQGFKKGNVSSSIVSDTVSDNPKVKRVKR